MYSPFIVHRIIVCHAEPANDYYGNATGRYGDPSACMYSGVGSIRMLQGPPIQVVGVALITEFCDHNYSLYRSYFSNLNQTFMKKVLYMMKIGRKHTQGFCIKPDYWGGGGGQWPSWPPWFLLHWRAVCTRPFLLLLKGLGTRLGLVLQVAQWYYNSGVPSLYLLVFYHCIHNNQSISAHSP